MKPLLFLDLDDVLAIDRQHCSSQVLHAFRRSVLDEVPKLWESIFDDSACENLRALHAEFEPTYIISSSWADFLSRMEICEVMRRTEMNFIAESLHHEWKLPHLKTPERAADIEAWLYLHNQTSPQPFVILDDAISGHPLRGSNLEGHAVLCNAWCGFTKKKLELAQSILRAQMNSTAPNHA
jgi:hypothetical protein